MLPSKDKESKKDKINWTEGIRKEKKENKALIKITNKSYRNSTKLYTKSQDPRVD